MKAKNREDRGRAFIDWSVAIGSSTHPQDDPIIEEAKKALVEACGSKEKAHAFIRAVYKTSWYRDTAAKIICDTVAACRRINHEINLRHRLANTPSAKGD